MFSVLISKNAKSLPVSKDFFAYVQVNKSKTAKEDLNNKSNSSENGLSAVSAQEKDQIHKRYLCKFIKNNPLHRTIINFF